MEYVLGIDAGGSKYLVKAADLSGNVIGEYETPSSNVYDDGENYYMRQYVDKVVLEAIAAMGLAPEDCRYLVCGSSGVDSPKEQAEFDEAYEKIGLPCPTHVVNDTEIALYAACGGEGVLVIAGTGSIAAGKNAKGETTRTGGWGVDIHSDQGSGRNITLLAMKYVSYYLDGLMAKGDSPLVDAIVEAFSVDADFLAAFAGDFRSYPEVVKKVPILVDEAYAKNDPYAKVIIDHAVASIAWLGDTIVTKLALDEQPSFKMSIWGSVALKCPYIFPGVKAAWEAKYPNVEVVYPAMSAADGALHMALEMLNA